MGFLKDDFTGLAVMKVGGETTEGSLSIEIAPKIRTGSLDFNKLIKDRRDDVFTEQVLGKLVYGFEVSTSYVLVEDKGSAKIPVVLVDIVDAKTAKDEKALENVLLDSYDIYQGQLVKFGEVIEIMKDGQIICTVTLLSI